VGAVPAVAQDTPFISLGDTFFDSFTRDQNFEADVAAGNLCDKPSRKETSPELLKIRC